MKADKTLDCVGLYCPMPIVQTSLKIKEMKTGEVLEVLADDRGIKQDMPAWCHSTGNELVNLVSQNGILTATIKKHQAKACVVSDKACKSKTIVVFSNDFDRVMASFIIANGAASMGSEVTMFFTFWGLNVLRRKTPVNVHKNIIERMLGMMMPRGASKLKLSKMNMGGLGTAMMKGIMQQKKVSSLDELINKAKTSGIKLVACSMSMDIMGIKKEELIDGIEPGGVAMYLDHAEAGNVNLFV